MGDAPISPCVDNLPPGPGTQCHSWDAPPYSFGPFGWPWEEGALAGEEAASPWEMGSVGEGQPRTHAPRNPCPLLRLPPGTGVPPRALEVEGVWRTTLPPLAQKEPGRSQCVPDIFHLIARDLLPCLVCQPGSSQSGTPSDGPRVPALGLHRRARMNAESMDDVEIC